MGIFVRRNDNDPRGSYGIPTRADMDGLGNGSVTHDRFVVTDPCESR